MTDARASTPLPPPTPQLAPADRHARTVEPERSRRSAWGTSVREFMVIVVGVLVALGAQAWWEGRQERERERDYLRQLLADTRINEQRLRDDIAVDSTSSWASTRVIAALDDAGSNVSADSLLKWIMTVGVISDFQPLTGTHRALFGTGDLRLIRSNTLRRAIMAYGASLDNQADRLGQLREVILNMSGDFGEKLPFMRVVFSARPNVREVEITALRRDPQVARLFFTYLATTTNRVNGLKRTLEETSRLRMLLEEELGTAADPSD